MYMPCDPKCDPVMYGQLGFWGGRDKWSSEQTLTWCVEGRMEHGQYSVCYLGTFSRNCPWGSMPHRGQNDTWKNKPPSSQSPGSLDSFLCS